MNRRLWVSLIGSVVIAVVLLLGNIVAGNAPILGLDLQGGVSVILAPVEKASNDDLIVIRDLIRDELERTGIAEPDVRVQGETIVVDLPGVRDQQEALSRVDVSGVVELRPVLLPTACAGAAAAADTSGGSTPADSTADTTNGSTPAGATPDTTPDSTPAGATPAGATSDRTSDSTPAGFAPVTTADTPADSTPADSTADSTADTTTRSSVAESGDRAATDSSTDSSGVELLPTRDGQTLCVGPAQGTGEVFSRGSAQVISQNGWAVTVSLRGDGQAVWNNLADQCFNRLPSCPSVTPGANGQIAIVLDSVIQSAPSVNTTGFTDGVSITGSFTRSEASDLARVLNRGAFPVEVQAQEARTVSASAGSDSLRAAIIAGLIGFVVVLTFLIVYYRMLALVVLGGMIVWAMAVYSAAALVSGWTNYALSLAGITGIIVAVGVTVDSYIVFFERMKDEVRNGRTLRNAAPRSFKVTWRTIWTADLVSVIGAAILFWLSVGSVRGFALYLGITTICDLLVCYFFTRPAVLLLSRSPLMAGRKAFGLEVVPA